MTKYMPKEMSESIEARYDTSTRFLAEAVYTRAYEAGMIAMQRTFRVMLGVEPPTPEEQALSVFDLPERNDKADL